MKKVLSVEQIDGIYEKLMKYCLVDDKIKQAHIDEIKLKRLINCKFRCYVK